MANKESTCAYSIDSAYKNHFVEDINFHKIEVFKCIRLVYHVMATIHLLFGQDLTTSIYTKHLVNIPRFVKGRYMIIDDSQ